MRQNIYTFKVLNECRLLSHGIFFRNVEGCFALSYSDLSYLPQKILPLKFECFVAISYKRKFTFIAFLILL